MLPQQPSGRLEVLIDLLDKSERQKGSVFHMWDNAASGNYCLFAGKSKGSEIISQKGVGCTFRDQYWDGRTSISSRCAHPFVHNQVHLTIFLHRGL